MKQLAAILLCTLAVQAQPVVSSTEQSYGPYVRPERGGRHALAAGGGGALLAWSENVNGSRIHVGLLDSRARLVSPISILPLANEGSDAYASAVSFNGQNFLVAWIERYRGGERMRGALVDGNGNPIGTPQPYGFTQQVTSNDLLTPSIVWDGAAWHVPEGSREGVQAATMDDGVYASAIRNCSPSPQPNGRNTHPSCSTSAPDDFSSRI